MAQLFKINGRTVPLTNLDKKMWPQEGINKYDLVKYYLAVSPYLLPHLRSRPLVCRRFPGGINSPGFFQKNIPQGAPSWVKTFPFRHGSKVIRYILAAEPETLAWLGNQGCLEIHTWLSSIHRIENPDFAVFDFDPPGNLPLSPLIEAVAALGQLLLNRGCKGYVKTSGKRGVQVYVPLAPVYSYPQVREFAAELFKEVHAQLPGTTTLERNKAKRGQKIYLDFWQNALGKTMVAPYSARPLKGAPVSTPLQWSELSSLSSCTMKDMPERLQEKGDLFKGVLQKKQKILR